MNLFKVYRDLKKQVIKFLSENYCLDGRYLHWPYL